MRRTFVSITSRYYPLYLLHVCALSPLFLLGILLQHLWILLVDVLGAGVQEWGLAWKYDLKPLWLSWFDLFTPTTCRRAKSLARGDIAWGRINRR